jgi:DNA-binding transcriptional MerR regulator
MSSPPGRGYLSISEVLAQLRAEFPDISVSKIRFLETEGLIAPARAPSGYRRFAAGDVERLRYILTAQRDQYLPLRVIKERLTRAEQERRDGGAAGLLTRRELIDQAGITEPQLTELEMFGLVRKAEGRLYARDALEVARTAAALTAYGVEARHLRTVRAAVEREVNLIEHVVAPMLKQRGAGARELAGQTAGELAGLATRLHQALIEGALAEAGLAGADTRLDREDPAADRATARRSGVRGASA